MLPLKWKIFRVINFIHLFFSFVLFILMLKFIVDSRFSLPESLFVLPIIAIGFNCYLNLHVVRRFFPDKLLPDQVKNFKNVLFILNIFIALALIGVLIIGAESEFSSESSDDISGKIALAVFFLMCIEQIYILILQFQISDFLKDNYRNKIETLIDSIGKPESET